MIEINPRQGGVVAQAQAVDRLLDREGVLQDIGGEDVGFSLVTSPPPERLLWLTA